MTRWIGKERFLRRIRKLPDAVREQIRTSIRQSAEELVAAQKRNVPENDEDLREAISWRWGSARGRGGSVRDEFTITIFIKKPAGSRAHFTEFGTAPHENKGIFAGTQHPGTRAQPFFYPTYRAHKRRIKSRVRRGVRKAILSTKGS